MGRKGSKSPSSSGMPPKEEPMEKKKEPAFVFHCLGREMVEVDVTCAFESEILYGFLSRIEFMRSLKGDSGPGSARDDRNIGFPMEIESPKHIVLMVNEFCVGRYNIMKTHKQDTVALFLEKLKEFDAKFVTEKPLSILVLLLNAAIQLRMGSLMNLVRNAIADLHDREFAVNVPDYIKKSKVACYVEDTWTLDGIPGIPEPARKRKRPRAKGRMASHH